VQAVITFNLEYDAQQYGVAKAASLIRNTGAQIALLQESSPLIVKQISRILGWHYASFGKSSTAILSEWPVKKLAEGEHCGLGVVGAIYVCVIHLSDYPYVAFEAVGINYPAECAVTPEQPCFHSSNPKILQERSFVKRQNEFEEIIELLTRLPPDASIICGGDFNEPSHQDWTPSAEDRGDVPIAIRFPSTIMMEQLGFVDSYRTLHPRALGYTWPDREVEYEHRRDRIDYIFVKNLTPISSKVLKTKVSDHSIVKTQFAPSLEIVKRFE
jgi:exodeoxyribonuclease-3